MLKEQLLELQLPDLFTMNDGSKVQNAEDWKKRRPEVIEAIQKYEYGYIPQAPAEIRSKELNKKPICAGKATKYEIDVAFDTPDGEFSFMYTLILPNDEEKHPLITHIAFRPSIPDIYVHVEEVIDNGFALAIMCYKEITDDVNEFYSGIALKFGERNHFSWGKIGMWAYCTSRVLDDLYQRNLLNIDYNHVAVMGHSRLGKTALLTGALDERFQYVISNDSGCGGAGLIRAQYLEPGCETVDRITQTHPEWFNKEYPKYARNLSKMPIDQHFLMAACAPRHLYVASAVEDLWANPKAEFLATLAASEVWALFDKKGLVLAEDRYPEADEFFHEGAVGYHYRSGRHYLSRQDWMHYMAFIRKKMTE